MSPAVRPPRPEDIPAIVALGEAFDRALTGTGDWSEEDVEHDWRALADPERDAWVVEDGGAVVGYATFQDDDEGTFEADGYVHPDRFGEGIGATLAGLAEARAAERLEAVTLPRVVLQNAVLHVDAAARALLEGRGYRPVRHFLRMQRLAALPQRQRLVERGAAVLQLAHDRLELVAGLLEGRLGRRHSAVSSTRVTSRPRARRTPRRSSTATALASRTTPPVSSCTMA